MKRRSVILILLFASWYVIVSEPASRDLVISCSADRGELEIRFQGERLLLYVFATNQFKPYVKELYTLAGQNILRDSPADHLHHHGLMYAIRVNGINFWEEVGEPGRERSLRITPHKTESHRASFTHIIEWTANTSNIPMMYETRTISLSVDEAKNEVALDWQSSFQVGAAPVQLTGSGYNGLGLRLPESFDHIARHENSADVPYTPEQKWDVTAADWSAVTGDLASRKITIALFDARSNPGEARFFTMLNPFAYLSVTQNLEKQPLKYSPGEHFAVRYLLTAYSEEKRSEFLDQRYHEWLCATK
jgi:hypothetical protein